MTDVLLMPLQHDQLLCHLLAYLVNFDIKIQESCKYEFIQYSFTKNMPPDSFKSLIQVDCLNIKSLAVLLNSSSIFTLSFFSAVIAKM